MAEPDQPLLPGAIPEAVTKPARGPSLVWLIPLIAAVIGVYLAYKAYSEKGSEITITFPSAAGLEAGKTKIKHKDVEIGEVESIHLSEDLSQVRVTARLVREFSPYLTEHTRFWVVRARIAAGEVSGLETLLAGAYIGVEPAREGEPRRAFQALATPPIVTKEVPGRHFVLQASTLSSLDVGSPVYYRQIKVGQVVSYALEQEGQGVAIKIFVQAPHHERVRRSTRFWNASGLQMTIDANGVQVSTESFVTLLVGGVAFDIPTSLEPDQPAEEGSVFQLYANRNAIQEQTYARKAYYILHFGGSVRGLSPGAPVEFRGIRLGEVVDFNLEFDRDQSTFRIPVLIQVEPDRIALGKGKGEKESVEMPREDIMEKLVEQGLRAQLESGNLLTGQLFVALDFHPEAPPAQMIYGGKYPELPTIPTPVEEIRATLTHLLKTFQKLPLEEAGEDLRQTILDLRNVLAESRQIVQRLNTEAVPSASATLTKLQALVSRLGAEVAPAMGDTLHQTRQTLAEAEKVLEGGAPLRTEVQRTLQEFASTARAFRQLADYLERHPEALLQGKGGKR